MNRELILSVLIVPLFIFSFSSNLSFVNADDLGGLHYVFWNFPIDQFDALIIDIGVLSEPSNNDGLYFQMYQGTINGVTFYFGLQTQTYKPGIGSMGRGLIFSRWETTDLSNVRVVEGGWSQNDTYEGDFVGVRRTYNWVAHNYRFKISLNDTDAMGDWYAIWITDLDQSTTDLLGAIRFPKVTPSQAGIANGGITWTELYSKEQTGTPIPAWNVSIISIYATNELLPPLQATSAYSTISGTDICVDAVGTIHFIMGPSINRTHPAGIILSQSGITNPTLSNFDLLFQQNSVRVVYPSENSPKPLQCSPALLSDWLASMAVTTKLNSYTEGLDIDAHFMNQTSGRIVGNSGIGLVGFGGPIVNPAVKFAEDEKTPLADRAPIRWHSTGGFYYFQHWNGASIAGASMPISVINSDEDIFVIETYMDWNGRYILLCYGFGWKGTYAAGKYFDQIVYPNLYAYDVPWVICKWEDTNNDGFVNNPGDGDTYTVIASG